MSGHLVDCAASLDLPASTKLALMAFADSADRSTRIGLPGLETVMRWSGASRSRCFELVAELVDAGLLRKHRPGHRGQRAEYVVFPQGCCAEHPLPTEVDDDTEEGSDPSYPNDEKGSGGPDSVSVNGSGGQDPNSPAPEKGSDQRDPLSEKGSRLGPTHRTPSSTRNTNPPTPERAQGCSRHVDEPGTSCRACGTSPRTAAKTVAHAEAERLRLEEVERIRLERAATAAAAVDSRTKADLIAETRRTLAGAR